MKTLRSYIPDTKWKAWEKLPRKERALLIAAYIVDVLKPRESSPNRGEVVDAIVRDAGYRPADRPAWCACFVTACCLLAGYKRSELPAEPGRVKSWVYAAKKRHGIYHLAHRGDVGYWLNANGTGHMGFMTPYQSLEGNTSSGEQGSQRDGDGAYRRARKNAWDGFIRLPE